MSQVIKANSESELILTAASNVQKYRTRPVLPQFEDAWIRSHPGDLESRELESTNAGIRVDLNTKHNVTAPCGSYSNNNLPCRHPPEPR